MTRAERIRELDRAVVSSVWRRPDSVVDERPGWFQLTTPSSKRRWHNGVYASALEGGDVSNVVSRVVASYRATKTSFAWRLGPSAAPAALATHLAAAGLAEHSLVGMSAHPAQFDIAYECDVQVERVTVDTVDDYVTASFAGWSNPAADARLEMAADIRASIVDPSDHRAYFVARTNGVAVGSGSVLAIDQDLAYLIGSSVVPEARKRGVYRALVAERMQLLRSLGVKLATIQAVADTSAPICARLGFETLCPIRIFVDDV